MKVWVDLANSPHVPFFEPLVGALEEAGHEVLLTARDHAQTVALARQAWPGVQVVGGGSPHGVAGKGAAIAGRALALRRLARAAGVDVALSHGSYAQALAARAARIPVATMMDYEHQPANHLSFRLAQRVLVPEAFPAQALQRFGARNGRVVRYPGFKEELYLARFQPDGRILHQLELDRSSVLVVLRPPPDGALYHRMGNDRFAHLVEVVRHARDVTAVLLPRSAAQHDHYGALAGIRVPAEAVDARSLLAFADLTIGAGGTMTRESALLGTPTYTVFAGALAAVDAELVRTGRVVDLRTSQHDPALVKKLPSLANALHENSAAIEDAVLWTLSELVAERRRPARRGDGDGRVGFEGFAFDEELLRAARLAGMRAGKGEAEIVEEALRAYLGVAPPAAADLALASGSEPFG